MSNLFVFYSWFHSETFFFFGDVFKNDYCVMLVRIRERDCISCVQWPFDRFVITALLLAVVHFVVTSWAAGMLEVNKKQDTEDRRSLTNGHVKAQSTAPILFCMELCLHKHPHEGNSPCHWRDVPL